MVYPDHPHQSDHLGSGERLARLALYLGLNCNNAAFHRVMRHTGSAEGAFGQDLRILGVNLTPLLTGGLFEEAQSRLEFAKGQGLQIVIWGDDHYPARLDEIIDPPAVLWIKGQLEATDQFAVGLVGSRAASSNALNAARLLGREGAQKGLTIVSGLAKGVDAQAHLGALEAGGRTLAVLGCGLNWVYPKENALLYEKIATSGALITEFPPDARPLPINFPKRNRIIAGLSLAVVVVEAGQRSGALITARLALEMNREVMALPGPAGSAAAQGTNNLIKTGAALVENMDEVLAEIKPRLLEGLLPPPGSQITPLAPWPAQASVKEEPRAKKPTAHRAKSEQSSPKKPASVDPKNQNQAPLEPAADSPEGRVLTILRQTPQDADTLIRQTGLDAAQMAVTLLNLELTGAIARLASGKFEAQ